MLTEEQIGEVREHLEKAQNPLFLYDNDADGLCSFIILRKFINRGKGAAIRSYPDLNQSYAKRAEDLKADYVFILDKPVVSKEFFDELDRLQIPVVWIDHHDMPGFEERENVHIYNPAKNSGADKSFEPVTYLAYMITNRKEDIWLAVAGCVSDHYLPDFADEFGKKYPNLWGKGIKEPFDAYYKTEIGKIAKAFNFGIKDSMSNVIYLQNFLIKCKGPEEIFLEHKENSAFRKKFSEIEKKYDRLLEEAKKNDSGKLIFFQYGGDMSISSEISNELSYNYPKKYVCVVYTKGSVSNVSLRGKDVRKILENILKKFENASGGGHENAVGARVRTEDLERFKKALEGEVI